jgi:mRNA interferase MazF
MGRLSTVRRSSYAKCLAIVTYSFAVSARNLRHEVRGFDEITSPSDDDYASSGLMGESLIRLGFLAVTPSKNIAGSIGSISRGRHGRLLSNLSDYLLSDIAK